MNSEYDNLTGEDGNEQLVQPGQSDTEINPGQVGNNTEVDLDTTKIENYPNQPNEEQRQQ